MFKDFTSPVGKIYPAGWEYTKKELTQIKECLIAGHWVGVYYNNNYYKLDTVFNALSSVHNGYYICDNVYDIYKKISEKNLFIFLSKLLKDKKRNKKKYEIK